MTWLPREEDIGNGSAEGEVMPSKAGYSHVDLDDPENRQRVTDTLAHFFSLVSRHHPDIVQKGLSWYPTVEEATEKGMQEHFGKRSGLHELAGPGVVAAVSPNMEWESANINAFGELAHLSKEDWKAIGNSAAANENARQHNEWVDARAEAGEENLPAKLKETGRENNLQAKVALAGKGIAKAPDANLLKARDILEGANPLEIMSRRSAPKTHSFMHNIAGDPHFVTIDGRAFDMAVNQMRPWTENRGINSAALPTGKKTRYEHFEDIYTNLANSVTVRDVRTGREKAVAPHHLQAILWEYGRHLETQGYTKAGTRRTKGVERTGQAYLSDRPMVAPARVVPPPEQKTSRAARSAASKKKSFGYFPHLEIPQSELGEGAAVKLSQSPQAKAKAKEKRAAAAAERRAAKAAASAESGEAAPAVGRSRSQRRRRTAP